MKNTNRHGKHNRHNEAIIEASAPKDNGMSKQQFRRYRDEAIDFVDQWLTWHLAEYESEIAADHTITAQQQFECAERADYCLQWLKVANRSQFEHWVDRYFQTGSMIVKAA